VEGHGVIDEQVQQLVRSHRPELEALVDRALAAELDQLVTERLAARNGHTTNDPPRAAESPQDATAAPVKPAPRAAARTKTCRGCGKQKPVSEYETGRGTCRACRRAQVRERAVRRDTEQAPPDEPGRPAIAPVELAERVRQLHGVDADELTRWLQETGYATIDAGLLRPTDLGLAVGGGIGP
jgi:hypothetical protein